MEEKNIDKNEVKEDNIENNDLAKNTDKEKNKAEMSPDERIKELEDKLTRTLAEMENQRRRYEKEKDDAYEYGGFAFARETLSLLDNLDRSKISLENDEELKNSDTLKKIFEHLDIIKKDMISIFKKNNIEQIDTKSKKLDPNFHQAMMEVEDDAKEPGTIVKEIQTGFMMKDRLLRPALVAVSKKTNKSSKKDQIDKNQEKNDKK